MMTETKMTERDEIEALLPWYANGTLSRRDADRVERALTTDSELAHRLELVQEELGETVLFNESLGAPSSRAMNKLMSGIAADRSARVSPRFSLSAWINDQIASLTPRTIAYAGAAAAIAIALQAGLLANMYVGQQSGSFETASHEAGQVTGSFALIGFTPQASAADITRFLETNKLAIVDGPRGAGLFKVRIGEASLSSEEIAGVTARLQANQVVRFIAPSM